ncbi:formate/nitrite transporter family protein [Acuticoccus sp. I52.16.1]|uniref:formate/nitrite transporter family protein n=1 Tax=Acuticoccus sp. I52.16.1 TaxID=2928472 RepID=UPI001FD2E0AB|nr:formate/nitrite transporter family protein [Acuticoccus sp. I52.16.1]UOM32949.1 formate/nitrite transporter family protein [Acuticoccus sp. I52.16.1]
MDKAETDEIHRDHATAKPDRHDHETAERSDDHDPAIDSLSTGEERDAIKRAGPRPQVVYASISARGLEELNRPAISLFGSGVAAGLVLMMSVISEALIMLALPEMEGATLIGDIGYTFGFLIVILGRLQLFTENTITPVLPLLANPKRRAFYRTGRLWLTVFAANLVGVALAAVLLAWGDIVTDVQYGAILEVAGKVAEHTPFETLRYGIIAGFLIAAIVWCLPTAGGGQFFLVFTMTYIIALGDFTHVIAGAGEGILLFLEGQASLGWVVFGLIVPAFVGNVLGGTVLFATLAYVQVMEEISQTKRRREGPAVELAPRPRGPA